MIGHNYSLSDHRELANSSENFHEQSLLNIENEIFNAPFMEEWFRAQVLYWKDCRNNRAAVKKSQAREK